MFLRKAPEDDARLGLASAVFARVVQDESGQVLPLLLFVLVALLGAGMLVFWLGVSTSYATVAQTAADAAALAAEKNVVQQLEEPAILEGGAYVQPPIDWGEVRSVAARYARDNGGEVTQLNPIQESSGWDVSVIVSTLNGMPAGSPDAAEHAVAAARASTDPMTQSSPSIPISNDASVASGPRFVSHGGTFGFFPMPNANYTVGQEAEIAGRLDQFAIKHKLHITGRVGYMPSISAKNTNLHDCGAASTSVGLPSSVTDGQLKDAGLERLSNAKPGQAEEIALAGTSQSSCKTSATNPVAGNGNVHLVPLNGGPQATLVGWTTGGAVSIGGAYSLQSLENLWIQAGGDPSVARTMAAVALAESSGIPTNIQQGQPYATTGWGLWQITPGNSEPQFGTDQQLLNPLNNAKAAVAKYRAQGLGAWTTYTSGAYAAFL